MSALPARSELESDFSPYEIFFPHTSAKTLEQEWGELVAALSNAPATVPESSASEESSPGTTTLPSLLNPPALKSIQSSYISGAVHQKILTHFATLPPEATNDYSLFGKDRFYTLYVYEYCHGTSYGQAPTYPPLCFRQIIEEGLLFYIRTIYLYYDSIGKPILTRPMWLGNDPRKRYLELFLYFGSRDADPAIERGTIKERCKRGLMRDGQVVLLEMVIRKLFIEIEALLGLDDGEDWKMAEMERMIVRTDHSIRAFFGSEMFRSERLEVLLLKHIAEEEINWDVVRGVEMAQRAVELRFPDWPEQNWQDHDTSEEDEESLQEPDPVFGDVDELGDGAKAEVS